MAEEAPYSPDAADSADVRLWRAKTQLAAAETAGDADEVKKLRAEVDAAKKDLRVGQAASQRRQAAEGDPVASLTPPAGRSTKTQARTDRS
jgi:hypothetical protein